MDIVYSLYYDRIYAKSSDPREPYPFGIQSCYKSCRDDIVKVKD